MMIDTRGLEDGATVQADLCIVGGGPVGLAIADAATSRGLEVVLLEGGGLDWDQDDQELYWGESVGRPYLPLDGSRERRLGGNSHVWGGWCAPYRDRALEPWPWIADSGWPVGWAEMATHVDRAARLIGLPEDRWDSAYWEARLGVGDMTLRPGVFEPIVELIRKTRFATTLGEPLARHERARLYLKANLTRIDTDTLARTVTGMQATTLENRRTLAVTARHYVLAMGGIENARQLLLADHVEPGGLGNAQDLVGRFFADHVSFHGGILQPPDPGFDLGLYDRHVLADAELVTQLTLPMAVVEAERLLRPTLLLRPVYDPAWDGDGMRAIRAIRVALRRGGLPEGLGGHLGNIMGDLGGIVGLGHRAWQAGRLPIDHVEVITSVPSAPNRDSRVALAATTDPLGLRHAELDWRLSPIDKRSARFMLETFAAEAGAAGIGRVQIRMTDDDTDLDDVYVEPACHHMGTTRMADDPTRGVVDRDCRVHGIDNLYCAGTSVFSTAGDGSPTMMALALALRLADHLGEKRP